MPAAGAFAERALRRDEKHVYQIRLEPNRFVQVRVEQLGADVYLSAFGPEGNLILTSESRNSAFGLEAVSVVASGAGLYRFEVGAVGAPEGGGRYRITLAASREATDADRGLLETERVFMEAMRLADGGSFASRRESLAGYARAAEGFLGHGETTRAAIAFNQLGHTQNLLGEKRAAVENYHRALEMFRAAGDAHGEAVALRFIGNWHKFAGDGEKAVEFFSLALEVARKNGHAGDEAAALQSLSDAYSLLGENEEAIRLARQALSIRGANEELGLFTNYFLLNRIGDLYAREKDWQKALDFYIQAIEANRKRGDRFPVNSYWRLGRTYVRLGDGGKALEVLSEGAAREEKTRDPFRLANLALGLGEANLALGDRQKAVRFFRESAATFRANLNPQGEAFAHFSAAQAERDSGDLNAARAEIEEAVRIVESLRSRLDNQDFRVSYFATAEDYYDLYLELLWQQHAQNPRGGFDREGWAVSERARARTLFEVLRAGRVDIRRGASAELLARERELQAALDEKAELHFQLAASRGKADAAEAARVGGEINDLTVELGAVQTKIRQASPRYAALSQAAAAPDLAGAQGALDAETVILEYKLGARRSFLWLVGRASLEEYELPPRAEVEPLARRFYEQLSSRAPEAQAEAARTSEALSRVLLGAVSGKLGNMRLLVVADGALQLVPFAALTSQQSGAGGPKLLAEENEVVVLPSVGVSAELRRNAARAKAAEKTIAVFADPVFEAGDPRLPARAKAASARPAGLRQAARDFDFGEMLPRLLSSRAEARSVLAFAPKGGAAAKFDFDASRENVTGDGLSDYRVLHFATHGLLDTARPELSGLVFSLYDEGGKPRDGFLRLNQIYNLNLNSDLVVLSACQTALGKDVRGEGIVGLTRGFLYAGARRVVATLWKVDDAATAEFMRRFYQNYLQKGLPASSALRRAQGEMSKVPRYRAPYFWAGFTLQGDWQ